MGGKGTFASGKKSEYKYKTVAIINGVKVLQKIDPKSSGGLPEESHSSRMYILLNKDGIFKQLRVYDNTHKAIFEIGYHRENGIEKEPKLHVHIYSEPGEINHNKSIKFNIGPGNEYYEDYKQYFIGI